MSQPVRTVPTVDVQGQDTPATHGQDARATPIPLDQVRPGQEVILAGIDGRRGLRHRLMEMGLRTGVRLSVMNAGGPGPYILAIGDTRLVLGQAIAHRVLVLPATS